MSAFDDYKKKALDCFAHGAICGLDVLDAIGRATTCHQDMTIAEIFGGDNAIKETVEGWLKEWGDDIVFMTELYCDLNHKSWEWSEKGVDRLTRLYYDLQNKVGKHIHSSKKFSKEDFSYFFRMSD